MTGLAALQLTEFARLRRKFRRHLLALMIRIVPAQVNMILTMAV